MSAQEGRVVLHTLEHEQEYIRRTRTLRVMLDHLKKKTALAECIKREESIPEQARDIAVQAISSEVAQGREVLFEFLANFITLAAQTLHAIDLEAGFTLLDSGALEPAGCAALLDGTRLDFPIEVAQRLALLVLGPGGSRALDARGVLQKVIAFYEAEETRFDRILGGDLSRCSLKVHKEIYPGSRHLITIRLPAEVITRPTAQLVSTGAVMSKSASFSPYSPRPSTPHG
ncbi:MAG: hypothetical protein NT074_01030 [Methanomicrobiales archaeon]|nr:hypothetical protein [Methanomicrobiales archaeon]